MRRIHELVKMVEDAHPNDPFFISLDETLRSSSQATAIYRAYDQALSCLDVQSWNVLSKKAVDHFPDHRKGQLKQGFFNQLNEAFAYQFLLQQGYKNIEVLQENGHTKPDIAYREGAERLYCEVKSIGISDDQISRDDTGATFDASIYQELSAGFLNKLDGDLKEAYRQISSQGGRGLVFVFARFDDIALDYYDRYREQLSEFLHNHDAEEVFIQIGLMGRKFIHKRRGQIDAC